MTEKNPIIPFTDNMYEHPFGERIKLLMRLEIIFKQAIGHQKARDQYETQMCLNALFALLNLTNRYELRLVMLKELERIHRMLLQIKTLDDVSESRFAETLDQLNHCKKILHGLNSKHIDRLRNIEFLNTIKLRNIHETGSYLFEIPELRYWLLQRPEHRSGQIKQWLEDFTPFKETTDFLLHLIRDNANAEEGVAKNGVYIKTMASKTNVCQLLRIKIDERHNVYPSISGDGYRFVIRFMHQKQVDIRAKQAVEDVHFSFETCGF
ncbi:MAG: hypothetical protein CR975_02820 [Gammaproteobacteria bacterium]|nr:MAG: hypothetical protein CR975_02820 [Gammaproteobacteria bacterium]